MEPTESVPIDPFQASAAIAEAHVVKAHGPIPVTAERFRQAVGCDPAQDDLERCNCPDAGRLGHSMCGWDDQREMPRFLAHYQPQTKQDAELIALAGRMGLHSISSEQLSALQPVACQNVNWQATAAAPHARASVGLVSGSIIPPEVWNLLRDQTKLTVGPWREPQIPVTDEMIKVGKDTARTLGVVDGRTQLTAVYRAMAAVAPVELVSANEDRIAELEVENVAWLKRCGELSRMLEARDARIAELKSELAMRVTTKPTAAQQTATDLKPTNEPKAMPANALKPTNGDPRRIGG